MLHVNVDRYHTTNRTATTNGPISLACAAGLGKYGYGNGFTVMERISGTVLMSVGKILKDIPFKKGAKKVSITFLQSNYKYKILTLHS